MNKNMFFAGLTGSLLLSLAASAQAAPVITVTPTLAPNIFGSPSFNAWLANSIEAQRTGQAVLGTAGTPTLYKAQSNVTSAEAIVTGFPSWLGKADPAANFGAAFANELGNRMAFGIKIDGNGTQFSISQLSFLAESSDPENGLGFSFAAGSYAYNSNYVGFLKGDDGLLFTDDDILVMGGASDQLVDGLIGRGSGNSFAAYCLGCSISQQQAAIDEAAAYLTQPTTFTGTYTLGDATGSGTFNIAAVPEPASWAMMIGGFGLAGFALRRRERTAVRYA